MSNSTKEPLSLKELSIAIKQLLEEALGFVRVRGEVSNLSRPASGHLYFSLKDGTDLLPVVFFKSRNRGSVCFENGQSVVVSGSITAYSPRGNYQLLAEEVELDGRGNIQERLRKLNLQLESEGLFLAEHKKPLPYLPKRIGIVSSPSGAALRDILQVISRRHAGANILIYPTQVQGEHAASQIATAILDADFQKKVDVLIVGRGGGSTEDLWCFNEEVVVRAAFACRIPIISAVGHEVDFVLLDKVADRRALTPSEAAEMVLPLKSDLLADCTELKNTLVRQLCWKTTQARRELDLLRRQPLLAHPLRVLELHGQKLDDFKRRLVHAISLSLQKSQHHLRQTGLKVRLQKSLSHKIKSLRQSLAEHAIRLDGASPLRLGERGYYPLCTSDNKLVKDHSPIKIGDNLKIHQRTRSLELRVENIFNTPAPLLSNEHHLEPLNKRPSQTLDDQKLKLH